MFQFDEGERVTVKRAHPALDLAAGAAGTVWVRYTTEPPAYDVTFASADGTEFDAVMDEDELAAAPVSAPHSAPAVRTK